MSEIENVECCVSICNLNEYKCICMNVYMETAQWIYNIINWMCVCICRYRISMRVPIYINIYMYVCVTDKERIENLCSSKRINLSINSCLKCMAIIFEMPSSNSCDSHNISHTIKLKSASELNGTNGMVIVLLDN